MKSTFQRNPLPLCALGLLAAGFAAAPLRASAEQPSAKATCYAPDHVAAIRASLGAEYPLIAREETLQGTAVVRVSLTQAGRLTTATIEHSSGYPILDSAALRAVDSTTYVPETVSCQPVSGDYLVDVTFER